MRIEGQPAQQRPLEAPLAQPAKAVAPVAAADAESAAPPAAHDSVQLSPEARRLLGTGRPGGPAIRPEMVERARAVLESKLFNDRAVLEKTAERIARDVEL